MRAFALLTEIVDDASSADRRIEALERHLATASDAEAAWALFLLGGGRLERRLASHELRMWAEAITELPSWLVEHVHREVGDLCETVALLVAPARAPDGVEPLALDRWLEGRILPLRDRDGDAQRDVVAAWWRELPARECRVLNKLLTGGLRSRIRRAEIARAVARRAGIASAVVALRLDRAIAPTASAYRSLFSPPTDEEVRLTTLAEPDVADTPLTIDAVLIYAEAGRGADAGRLTRLSFAVWREDELVTLTKTDDGLDDDERTELDRWIRRNTVERFGPVRRVEPRHVFRIAFDSLATSRRTRSGLTLRNPRILEWRRELGPTEADTLAHALALAAT